MLAPNHRVGSNTMKKRTQAVQTDMFVHLLEYSGLAALPRPQQQDLDVLTLLLICGWRQAADGEVRSHNTSPKQLKKSVEAATSVSHPGPACMAPALHNTAHP
jgi:hypothetical protein